MKLSFLITLFLLISISSASAQADNWMPVGEGLPGKVYNAAVGDDGLYVLYFHPYDSTYTYAISKWDDSSWTKVVEVDYTVNIASLRVYKGELYIGGDFETINGLPGTKGIARWDGTSWQSVGGGLDDTIETAVYDMIEYRGDLYCTGTFINIGGIRMNGVARWDGTRWHPLGTGFDTLPGLHSHLGYVLAVYKDELYVGGIFGRAGNAAAQGIARWNGEEWRTVGTEVSYPVQGMIVYNDRLYVRGSTPIARWDGSTWEDIPIPQPFIQITRWAVSNGRLYAGSWEQGTIARFDDVRWETLPGFNAELFCLISYKGQLYAGGGFKQLNGNPIRHIARLCDAANCGLISGNIFHDINSNCVADNGEHGLARCIIEMTPGPYYAMSKPDGSYAQYVPPGTYDVKLIPREHWNQICPTPPAGYNVTFAIGEGAMGKDFGLRPGANIRDVRVSMVSGPARPGMDLTYVITYENVGTVPVDGTVRFQYDPRLIFVSSTTARTRHAGNIIEWDFKNLAVDESHTITVTMRVPQATAVGTKLCGSIDVDLDQLDLRIHQRDTSCIDVTGSYDPNDISVAPFGIENNGEISPEDSILTYVVRFQNTGNDTAFRVVVVDTLSPHLDIATIIPGAASHPFSFSLSGKEVATWTFENILLPDSNVNERKSHGFFKYTIHQRKNLASGTEIPNRVEIYFDYNAPVATNTIVSIIMAPSSVPLLPDPSEVMIYPNPARGMLHLRGVIADDARIELRDLLGNRMAIAMERMGEEAVLDLRGIASGTYFVAIATKHGTTLQRITVAR